MPARSRRCLSLCSLRFPCPLCKCFFRGSRSTHFQSPVTRHQSLFQRFHFFPIDLPSQLHAPRHTHRSRFKHQSAIAVICIRKKHHLIQPALILQCHKHHVPVILRSHMPVSHHPSAQCYPLPPQSIQLVAPDLAIPRQKIQRMPAHAHLQNFPFVSQLLFLRLRSNRHPRQGNAYRVIRSRISEQSLRPSRWHSHSWLCVFTLKRLCAFIRSLQKIPTPQHLRPRNSTRLTIHSITSLITHLIKRSAFNQRLDLIFLHGHAPQKFLQRPKRPVLF